MTVFIFQFFVNNTIFCDILVLKCCYYEFKGLNLNENFFAY